MRQMPEVPSATHKCLTGWFVTGLSAAPYKTIPPVGPVIGLWASGVPPNWIVLVVGVMVVWAFAEEDSKPNRSAMQNKISVNFTQVKFLFRAKTAVSINDFTFMPSCPANLGLRDHLTRDEEGI